MTKPKHQAGYHRTWNIIKEYSSLGKSLFQYSLSLYVSLLFATATIATQTTTMTWNHANLLYACLSAFSICLSLPLRLAHPSIMLISSNFTVVSSNHSTSIPIIPGTVKIKMLYLIERSTALKLIKPKYYKNLTVFRCLFHGSLTNNYFHSHFKFRNQLGPDSVIKKIIKKLYLPNPLQVPRHRATTHEVMPLLELKSSTHNG